MLKYVVALIVVIIIGGFAMTAFKNIQNNTQEQRMENSGASVHIVPIEHASLIIEWNADRGAGSNENIYVDPVGDMSKYAGRPGADTILITDVHGDHFSTSTIRALMNQDTDLIVPQAVKDQLPADLASRAKVLANGEKLDSLHLGIEAIPMYNLPSAENATFHTKGRGNGYVLERQDGIRVYIAGDTAGTPEMRAMQNIDIALVPMNLPYTMSVEEAADAVLAFKPRTVYPYHYRGPSGLSDVGKFKQLVNAGDPNINVVLADWYPNQ